MKQHTFDAVIFDLDGTLVDSLEDLANAANAVLRGAGLPEHPVDAYRHFVGNGVELLLRRVLPPGHDQTRFEPLLDQFRRNYENCWHDCSRPYPGIAPLLCALQGRLPMAVLSNKPHDWTQLYVAHFFPDIRFDVVRGAMDGVPDKPNPTSALLVAETLECAPSRMAFVGDSSVDMTTAVNSGMWPVGVTWGFRDQNELLTTGARELAHNADALLSILLRDGGDSGDCA